MSTSEPGTMPPPRTRSISAMPETSRSPSSPLSAATSGWTVAAGRPERDAATCRSSVRLSQAPQSGQRPSHLRLA